MSADVLLAHAYFLAEDAAERQIMRPHPPLGLLYLSSHLKRAGAAVSVFDSTFRTFAEFTDRLDCERPPIVGIAVNLMTKRNALRMIAASRERGVRVVVGGPDPPYHAERYLDAGADVVVVGEGERTLEELLPRLRQPGWQRAVAEVPGVVFRDEAGQLVRTAPRALLPDLDAQPLPDREAADMSRYLDAWRRRHGVGTVSLITARGCPYTCTWCSRSVFGTTHRRRSVTGVADEVEQIVDRYRPERLWYADDVFAIHRAWTVAYARELERRGLRLPFECISRAERIDDGVADALESLGCFRVWIGSESGSQRILDAMQRRVRVEQVQDTSTRLRRRDIQVGLFIMLGYEGETLDDLRATIDHVKRIAPDVFLTTVAYPIKGTPYFQQIEPRVKGNGSWTETTDRDLVVRGRPVKKYYDFARRWIAAEVARDRYLRDSRDARLKPSRYWRAARATSSALVGRLGMAVTAEWRER